MKTKLIVAVLTNNDDLRSQVIEKLEENYGPTDFKGDIHLFEHSKYYNEEMGENLSRNLISFSHLIYPTDLPNIKLETNILEQEFSQNNKRQVNIDPGYLDHNKVVLASTKEGGHRLLTPEKIYLDFTLYYNKGWKELPWTYPDFKDGFFVQELEKIRKIYVGQMKQQ